MTVGAVVADLGVEPRDDEDVILVSIEGGKPVSHFRLAEIADEDPDDYPSLYLATGTFRILSVSRHAGRTIENVRRLLWLPFDADLTGWLGATPAEVHALPDETLARYLAAQREDLEATFAGLGLPIHRLDVTGYGHCAYVRLDDETANSVMRTRQAHKAIIARINERAACALVDVQASDAGTRITRLPGSVNNKTATPRPVVTVVRQNGTVDRATLDGVARAKARGTVTPLRTERLGDDLVTEIVEAIAPHWVEGQRHAMGLAVGGILAKAGVDEASALTIVGRLSAGDQKPWDREAAVRRSYARIRSGQPVAGFTALRGLIPASVLDWMDSRLGAVYAATAPRITIGGKAPRPDDPGFDDRVSAGFAPVPEIAYHGWFGAYRDLMSPTTEAPDAFHLGASLTLAGAMIGRRVATDYAGESLYANLYTVLIGSTGQSRKDTSIKRATTLSELGTSLTMRPAAFELARDVSSAEGIVQMLSERPNTLLYLTELATLLRNARRKSTSTILDKLIEAWDTPASLQNLSKLNPMKADRPYLSIISAVQPSRLANEMTDEDIHSGFANRWLYMVGTGKEPMARP
ncbi:MAG: YfjI family protein, partial [Chloroflexota bacterium]|nr:YfjI family protein [Chloroflexota bacterium]